MLFLYFCNCVEPVEEVIAEDYDDRPAVRLSLDNVSITKSQIEKVPQAAATQDTEEAESEQAADETDEIVNEVLLCPNLSNKYHVCSDFCRQRWGCKRFKPDPSMVSRHERLLRRYPLPAGWLEVGDPET